nr:MAG TPA: hypothetical protein [Caudoviricetes sp.]
MPPEILRVTYNLSYFTVLHKYILHKVWGWYIIIL